MAQIFDPYSGLIVLTQVGGGLVGLPLIYIGVPEPDPTAYTLWIKPL